MAVKTDSQRQTLPPFNRICSIASSGLKVRFGRSIITMGGICLALAYLVSIRVNGLVTENIAKFSQSIKCYDFNGQFQSLENAYHPDLQISREQVDHWRNLLQARAYQQILGEIKTDAAQRRKPVPTLDQLQSGAWCDGAFSDVHFLNTTGRDWRDAYLASQGLAIADLSERDKAQRVERLAPAERDQLITGQGGAAALANMKNACAAGFAEKSEIVSRLLAGKLEKSLEEDGLTANWTDIGAVHQERAARKWIINIVLIVAVAGIANAMLMSVTERFREIGTMKCLGAMDSLVLLLFLVETLVVGAAGALIGVVAGSLLGAVQLGSHYGWAALVNIPWRDVIVSLFQLGLVGLVLSILGGVGPALVAARMAPIEAMRVDQ